MSTLKNGLQVYVSHEPGVLFEHVRFAVRTGSFDEPTSAPGIAHFTEHVVCASSGRTTAEVSHFFEGEGADFTALTDSLSTVYGFSSALSSSRFQQFADFCGTSMLQPRFNHIIERERGAILSEFGQRYRSEKEILFELTERSILFHGTPLAKTLGALGTKESVKKLSIVDLYEYHHSHYIPQNISVVCTGGMDLDQVIAMLWHSGFCADFSGVSTPLKQYAPMPSELSKDLIEGDFTHDGVTTNSTCTWHWLVTSTHIPLQFYTKILTQLLMNALRGNALSVVYDARASFEEYRDFCELLVSADDFSAEHEAIVAEVMLRQMKEVTLQEHLFDQMKRAEILRFARYEYTLEQVCDGAVSSLMRFGKIKTMEEHRSEIEGVHFSDILAIVKQVRERKPLMVLERH